MFPSNPAWSELLDNTDTAERALKELANILQGIMLRIRRCASPVADSVRFRTWRVRMIMSDGSSDIVRPFMKPNKMPRSVDDGHWNQVLLHDSGQEAMVYLYPFVKEWLGGKCARVEEVAVSRKHSKHFKIKMADAISGIRQPDDYISQTTEHHYLYKITLSSGAEYALDPTALQFGLKAKLLIPWDMCQAYSIHEHPSYELGHFHSHVIAGSLTLDPNKPQREQPMSLVARRTQKVLLALEKNLPRLDTIKGKEAFFFLLDSCMGVVVEEVFGPDGLAWFKEQYGSADVVEEQRRDSRLFGDEYIPRDCDGGDVEKESGNGLMNYISQKLGRN